MALAVDSLELVLDAHATLGEGPIWDARNQVLYWLDIFKGEVHSFEPVSGMDYVIEVDQPVGSVAPRARGGLVLALRDGFGLLDIVSRSTHLIAEVKKNDPEFLMNDGRCDPQGRFWAGSTTSSGRIGGGALYRLGPDHRVVQMLEKVTCSNGLDWSPDGRRLYYIDSLAGGIDVFDFDPEAGVIGNRRRLVDIPRDEGLPDGMTVDAEGFIWVAIWDGWSVRRYDPNGRLARVIEMPVARVTSCAFGGPDLADLYITSAISTLSHEQLTGQPNAGGLFRCQPGPRGRPTNSYID